MQSRRMEATPTAMATNQAGKGTQQAEASRKSAGKETQVMWSTEVSLLRHRTGWKTDLQEQKASKEKLQTYLSLYS